MSYVIAYVLLNVLAPLVPHPKVRALYLRLLGARIGRGVRIENVRFVQIQGRIAHLECEDHAFIGSGVTLDLTAPIRLGRCAIVAPGCTLMTHQDFGHFNGGELSRLFPKVAEAVTIGDHAVVGCDTTVLAGSTIEHHTLIGAKSLVTGHLPPHSLCLGIPARVVRRFDAPC